mgnify:CR=1 FL=1
MKKIIKIIFNIILFIILNSNVYASSIGIKMDISQKEISQDEIQVQVSIANLEEIEEGINAYSGELNFNKDELELVEINSEEGWNMPIYNKEKSADGKIKIVATANQFVKDKKIFNVIFYKKSKKSDYNIQINDLEVATKIDGQTVKLTSEEKQEKTENIILQNEMNKKDKNSIWKILLLIFCIGLLLILLLIIKNKRYINKKEGDK